MKAKLIGVLVAVAALFIGAVLWRTDSFVYGDRMSWVEAQSRTQLGAINHSLGTELKSLQRVVANFTPDNFQKGKVNWSSLAPYYAAASFVVSGDKLEPQVVLVKENSKAASWDQEFIKSAVGSLEKKTADTRFYVKPFQDAKNGRYVALIFLEGGRAYALIGSGEIFQSLIDAQKGALSSFSIVTATGLTVGHSIPEYLGTVMRDDPVFREALQSGSSHGSNTFELKSGDIYGMYERVPQSNLLVLSSAPLKETMKGRSGLWWQFLLLGCGLVLVGIAVVLWVVIPADRQLENLNQQLQLAKLKPATAPVAAKVVLPDPEQVQKEKVQASMRVASALAHEMRGPLASILGYSQMILAKSPDAEIVQSTDSILREARAARSVLDKLLGYAGEEVQEKNSMKVEGPLVKALKEMDILFTQKGVKVTKNIQDTSALDLHVDAVIRALRNILQNSVEAMERMAKKEIIIDLYEDGEGVHLNIQDTGEGIEPENAEKIFDPFFTTRSFHNHMGLGLSVAFGILKEHNANLNVESQRGQGTKISILFKKGKVERGVLASLEAPIIKDEPVIIAAELPKLKEESVHREEAEFEFALAEEQSKPASPLDVNIDAMLDFPELTESTPAPAAVTIPASASQSPASVVTVAAPKGALGEDEFNFIDGFLSEQPATEPASATQSPAEEVAPVAVSSGPTVDELEMMNDELTPVDFVVAPAAPVRKKVSKLDSYHVEIRRPGKRI